MIVNQTDKSNTTPDATRGKLNAGVIGSGKISEEHLSFLSKSALAGVGAVCDLSPTVARWAAQRIGCEHSFTDYRSMLDQTDVDVVHVLTPPHTHVDIVGDCLEAGRHVIVEKPVAPTRDEFHRLWELAQKKGVRLIEDQNYRFNEPILEIDRLIREGVLGDVREVEVRMALGIRGEGNRYADMNLPHPSHNMPAGVLHEFLTHLCYLLLNFTGGFDRVAAAWRNHGGGDLFKYDELDTLVMCGPIHGRIRFSCATFPDCFTVTVRGSEATASTDLFQPHVIVNRERSGGPFSPLVNQRVAGKVLKRAARVGAWNKIAQKTPYEGLHRLLGEIYESIDQGTESPVSYGQMDTAAALIDAMLEEGNRI